MGGKENLNTQILALKRNRVVRKYGIIEAISLQGDKMYCVVREHDRDVLEGDTIVRKKGKLFGNTHDIPEEKLVLAEILIEADINVSSSNFEPEHFIGENVQVEMIAGEPFRVILIDSSINSRTITRRDIKVARGEDPKGDIKSQTAKDYLKSVGYDSQQIDAISKESLANFEINGKIIVYGDTADWTRSNNLNDANKLDMQESSKKGIVTGLPAATVGSHICYKPPLALTAR